MWAEKYIQESEDEIDEVMDRRGTFKPYEAPREENEEVTKLFNDYCNSE